VRAVVVALGNFDGVHLGHRAVLARAAEEARKRDGIVVAATFWPHPRSVIGRGLRNLRSSAARLARR
jgi:riboflavin kinase/FMN adenylyltransferase